MTEIVSIFGLKVNFVPLVVGGTFFFTLSRIIKFLYALKAVSYMPGMWVPFYPLGLPGAVLPTTWWNPGLYFLWKWKDHFYKNNENVSIIPMISGPPAIFTSNLDVARQVVAGGHKHSFVKPDSAVKSLVHWGMNLLASSAETWRIHRRIMGPAFSNRLHQLVWTETMQTYREMVSIEGWDKRGSVETAVVQKLTFKLALQVIGKCAFGFPFSWSDPPKGPDGTISLQESLRIVADDFLIPAYAPNWVQRLPIQSLQKIHLAHEQLLKFMHNQVAEKKAEIHGQSESNTKDAFSMLVKANEDEEAKFRLTDQELIGNVWVMLFAGQETTAHTLAATLAFLGVYDDIQQEVYDHIVDVIGKDRDPAYEDYPKLNKVLAAFFEALRMFPAGYLMIREAVEDAMIQIPNPVGQEGSTSLAIPKGVQVIVDMVGLQYNPRYFDEPERYKPSRWYGISSESEVFSAFSIGARACLGRKFATTEAVCFLTMLIRDWRIEPLLRENETKDTWRARVLSSPRLTLSLAVSDVPLRFVKRVD